MSVPEDLIELAAGYALGSLDEADRERVEALLDSGRHPELNEAVAEYREAAALIATGAPAAVPPPALKRRVMAAIAQQPAAGGAAPGRGAREDAARGRVIELQPRRISPWVHVGWGAAVAASLVATVAIWNETVRLERQLVDRRGQIAELESRLAEERRWAEMMSAPGARAAEMEMTTSGSAAMRGRVIFDPVSRSAVIAFENVAVPGGKDLELWALKPDGVKSMGIVRPGPDGRATMRFADVGDPTKLMGFALTVEKPGGSGNPIAAGGPIVMVGMFGG